MRAETQRQQDATISAGDASTAGDAAQTLAALDRRLSAIAAVERAAERQLAETELKEERATLERERAEIIREAEDIGAEMEAHGRVGRQIHARWDGTMYPRMLAWERKRMTLAARSGAAPEPIPFVDDRGMVPILGITQAYLRGLALSATGLEKMEQVREALNNPPAPEPKPRLTEKERRERDKRNGVVERARRPAHWDVPTPSTRTEERR